MPAMPTRHVVTADKYDPGPGGYGRLVQASPGRVLRLSALPTLEVPVDKVLGIAR